MASTQYPKNSEEAIAVGVPDIERRYGIRIRIEEEGRTVGELPLEDRFLNIYGSPDGGILFYLADTTSGIAFLSAGGYGVTASANVNFMRAAKPGTKKVICRAKVKKAGSALCYVSAVITDEEGLLLSEFSFVFCNRRQQDD